MKEGFVAEILRAAGTLRSGDPAGATDIIRAALAAGGLAHQGAAAADAEPQATAQRSSGPTAGEDQPPLQRKRFAGLRRSLGAASSRAGAPTHRAYGAPTMLPQTGATATAAWSCPAPTARRCWNAG